MPALRRPLLLFVLTLPWLAQGRDAETSVTGDAARFTEVLRLHFATWDADHDGLLSKPEINALIAKPELTGEPAAVAATLKRASRLTKVTLPDFSIDSLTQLATASPRGKDMPDLAAMFRGSLKRIQSANRELFSPEGPRIETIRQGKMGNCFSLAPLAALAHRRPDYIRQKMIQPQPDCSYLVRLGKEQVRVLPPTDVEIALCSANETGGLWVNVYEKAAGEAHNAKKPADKREPTGLDALNRGGSAGTQLAFITGHEMYRVSCQFAKKKDLPQAEFDRHLKELRTALTAATKEQRLMTTGTLKTSIPGITPNHAYAILSYDAASDTLRLWNPHGDTTQPKGPPGPEHGYPMKDGIFEMPLLNFIKEFAGTAYEVLPDSAS